MVKIKSVKRNWGQRKICSWISDTTPRKIDFTADVIHRAHPPAWKLNFDFSKTSENEIEDDKEKYAVD